MQKRRFLTFAGKVIVAHVVTYFIAGAIAYPLLTKQFYEGANPIFATFFRTPGEPELWTHVTTWFIPNQILRGLLIAIVLYPLFDTLAAWGFWKRFYSITGLYLVLGFWAAAVAAPGNLEGMVYMRPEITLYAHVVVQPEIIVQGIALGAIIAWWMAPLQSRLPSVTR